MKNLKRRTDLSWEAPTWPPRPVKRDALFSLMRRAEEIYFINDSSFTLEYVVSVTDGFVGETSVSNINNPKYEDVKPGESVLLEEYDIILDSDFILGLVLEIGSKEYGTISISSKLAKGGVPSHVLMYKDGTIPQRVNITREEK